MKEEVNGVAVCLHSFTISGLPLMVQNRHLQLFSPNLSIPVPVPYAAPFQTDNQKNYGCKNPPEFRSPNCFSKILLVVPHKVSFWA